MSTAGTPSVGPTPISIAPAPRDVELHTPSFISASFGVPVKADRPLIDTSSTDIKKRVSPKRKTSEAVRAAAVNRGETSRSATSTAVPPITMSSVRSLISRDALRSNKPLMLFKYLRQRSVNGETLPPQFVPSPPQLHEILSALAEYATNDYLLAMADDERYTVVFEKWLKTFTKQPAEWEQAIAPLLRILARTDMPVNYILDYNIGKLARGLMKKAAEKGKRRLVFLL